MRVKREYLTDAPLEQIIERVAEKFGTRTVERLVTDPIVIKRLAQIETIARDILSHEMEPETQDPDIPEIIARLDRLHEKLEQMAKAPPPPPPPAPPKPSYQFDVVRNAAGNIEKIVAQPVTGGTTIYGGTK